MACDTALDRGLGHYFCNRRAMIKGLRIGNFLPFPMRYVFADFIFASE
jgi:hypothetical protein